MKVSLLYVCDDESALDRGKFASITEYDVEWIIVYYGHSSATFFQNKHFRFFWYKDATYQQAMDFALAQAQGVMVTRVEDGVHYSPDFLECMYHPQYDLVYAKWKEGGEIVYPLVSPTWMKVRCCLWKTSFLRWIGGWKEFYPDHQDIPLLYRTFLLSNHTYFVDKTLATFHTKENSLVRYYMESKMMRLAKTPSTPSASNVYHVKDLKDTVQQLINLESFLFHHSESYVIVDHCLNCYYFLENYPNVIFGKFQISQSKSVDMTHFYKDHTDWFDTTYTDVDYESLADALLDPCILSFFRCKRLRNGSLIISIHCPVGDTLDCLRKVLKRHLLVVGDTRIDRIADVILRVGDVKGDCAQLDPTNVEWIHVLKKISSNGTIVFPHKQDFCKYSFPKK